MARDLLLRRGMLTSDPRFRPPFCPEPACPHHHDPTGWSWHRDGSFLRRSRPRRIQRFRCNACGRRFSSQSFDTTYWLKRPDLQPRIFELLVVCCGLRQAARLLGVAPSTVQRQAERLGRHCLLFQRRHGPVSSPTEPLVLDGFVTFELGQYWPFEQNLLVGNGSEFLYAFTESELRRSGRMTKRQKRRRAELEARHGKPDPRSTVDAVEALIRLVAPTPCSLVVFSDEHRAYPRAFARMDGYHIDLRTVSSRRCRAVRNPLFPVNLLDLLIRHCSANHKRETIAFSKRRQASLERLAVFQVWRNFMKRRSERTRDSPTPAQVLGLAREPLDVRRVLRRRLFPSRFHLPEPLGRYYRRDVVTRALPRCRRHRLRFAA